MWSTVASWVTLLALAAAVTSYYNPQLLRQFIPSPPQVEQALPEVVRPTNKRQKSKRTPAARMGLEQDASPPVSSNEQATKRRKVNSAPTSIKLGTEPAKQDSLAMSKGEESEMNNQAFAQQLAKAREGTQFAVSSKGLSKKERREAKALQNDHVSSGISAETSSTGGLSADDDLSPITTPTSGPEPSAPTSRAGDISDMLEPAAARPTTLRLIGVSETKPKSSTKAFEPVLSKKQKQRKTKQEENKLMREEADRLHEAKKQAQMRSARMAEGTSNQTKANTFSSNPWSGGKSVTAAPAPVTPPAPLLDTFAAVTVEDPSSGQHNRANGVQKQPAFRTETQANRPNLTTKSSWADQVDEAEQNKWASELVDDGKWENVANKKSKKVKKDTDTNSDASGSMPVNIRHKATTQPPNAAKQIPQVVNRYQSMEQLGGGDDWEA